MLYIARKMGESLVINDSIKVTVLEVRGKTAKLAFEYPPGTRVLRQELFDKIQQENRDALLSTQEMTGGLPK